MTKPMGSERSVMLISRLFILNFLLLWQPGTGTNSTTIDDRIKEVENKKLLPDDEVSALQLLSQNLQSSSTQFSLSSSTQLSLSFPICSDNQDAEIRCGYPDNTKNGSFRSVTEIILPRKKLDGSIHNSIGWFKNLERLDLYYNQLSGEIPSTLGQLQHLKYLDLSSNSLTGSIPPSLTMLRNLEYLDLSSNDLDGTIPSNLKGLQSLRRLDLSYNKLTGPIQDSIQHCKNLTGLALLLNSLSGGIPKELGKLSALKYLGLAGNDLHGELPKELGNLTNLRILYLTANNFNGTIPTTYEHLTNLQVFGVSGNYLSGPIPDYIGKWVNLSDLVLIGNNFSGNLPAETFSLTKLHTLWVSDVNNPGISFPKEVIPEPNYLSSVVLRNCNINGPIPEYIGKWPQLSYLDLSFNNLNGSIPGPFPKLTKLFLTRNKLTGLPSWITDPKKSNISRTTVDLSYNDFNVPCKNIKCLGLQNVTMSFIHEMKRGKCRRKHNSLFINSGGEDVYYGKDHYHNDTSISSFNLSPSDDWAYSYAGEYLNTDFNASALVRNLTCEITSAKAKIDNNFRLAPLSLTYYGLCLRKGEYIVTLYFAEALSSKSEDYSTSGKRVFDIYIQGTNRRQDVNIKEIPGKEHEGKQLDFPVKINDGSLEIQLFWAGKGSLYGPAGRNGPLISAVSITLPRKLHGWEIALIIGCCILFLLLLLAFMWRMGWIGDRELRETKVKIGERTFTLKQIIHATKKFSPKMQLGSGRSGIVYRAELPDLTVAVKKLFTHSKAVDEIGSEVYARKALDLKHENLVNLIASYSRRHLILLIYEYMEHGSLGQVLFGTNPTVQIDWQKRFIICRGIAKGLKYLHERNPPIIHRNIKANNILLDASCNPKISDFGLAKLYEEENPYIAIGAGGDLLYMSPEYATRRAMTVKVDVYSFGILLLEIVSGRNNADYRANQETVFLLDTAGNLNARGRLGDLVDPSLRTYDWDQAKIVLNLAMMCTDQSPSLRPTMSQVVAVLEGEKTLEDLSKEIAPST
ncbi:probable leucine-rich repeat receptor-like serine/threonine-protein kinase At3g14840 isoform X2 [Populus nigra]|uniref:probable leucine-rich repeat receptor-like serine/threonine-protein kinase At3g14840 isoform X2 n=1 Tax=Populus nigra TaxID=3691 RepID=UPI002B26AA1B|nr:probable leucine-rich repeat receptor-like serine/threonine-protein kinase At3g14840 isoform X2 [Populus nigra]